VSAPAVRIRRAGRDDVPRLVPLFDAYRVFYGQEGDLAGAAAFLAARLGGGESVVLLGEIEGVPAGFTQLYPSFSSVSLRRLWILNDLYVVPAARRRGVGAALLEEARAFAAAGGAVGLLLETARDNPARHLYEKLGWKRDEAHHHYTREC
jgi:GNAT superfamily N-acetyltransferase